jgi:drug/metabolite transporter (DMT)-like permease
VGEVATIRQHSSALNTQHPTHEGHVTTTHAPKATDWLLIAIPGLIWGTSFLFIAEGLEAVGPNGVTWLRLMIGFLTLSFFPAAWKGIPKEDWKWIAALAVVWMAFPLSMFPYAEQRVTSALTGMLNGANPLFTTLVAAVIARSLPGRGVLTGLGVGLVGVVLVALPALGEGRSSVEGVVMILAAMVGYGFALNIARPLQQRNGAIPIIWRAQGIAVLLTAPLGVPEALAGQYTLWPTLSLLALGMGGTAIAFIAMAACAGRFGAPRASSTTFLIPPVSLLLGVLVRDERVAVLSVIGGAVCVLGAWLMARAQTRG